MFKETIKQRRLELGLSLRQLEQVTGISNAGIYYLEIGRSLPTIKTVLVLADGLKMSKWKLLKIAVKDVMEELV